VLLCRADVLLCRADGLQETRPALEEELRKVAQVHRGVACLRVAVAFFLGGRRRGRCGDEGEGGAAEAPCKFCVGFGTAGGAAPLLG